MSAQNSPLSRTSGSKAFPQPYEDVAFEPQPAFAFGDVQISNASIMDDFSGKHGAQDPFLGAERELSQFGIDQLSFPQNAGGFGQYSNVLQQTSNVAGAWPSHGGAPSAFDSSLFQQSSGQVPRRSVTAIEKFGQVTPPYDASSEKSSERKASISTRVTTSEERSRSDKSERARNAALQRHSKTKKQRRASLAGSKASTGAGSEDESEDKKEKYREKNRLAAAKCRAKKKDNIEGIEDRHRNLSAMNSALKKQVQDLRGELTDLRTHALNHQGCNCRIAKYNVNQAQKVAMGVDGIGSPTGYGSFGHGPDCISGRGGNSKSASAVSSRHRSSASQIQAYVSPSTFAYNAVGGGHDGIGEVDTREGSEAEFAEYLQAEFGA